MKPDPVLSRIYEAQRRLDAEADGDLSRYVKIARRRAAEIQRTYGPARVFHGGRLHYPETQASALEVAEPTPTICTPEELLGE